MVKSPPKTLKDENAVIALYNQRKARINSEGGIAEEEEKQETDWAKLRRDGVIAKSLHSNEKMFLFDMNEICHIFDTSFIYTL